MALAITSVDGVLLPHQPQTCKWNLYDVSAPDSGRTEDTNMQKNRLGSCVKLECSWAGLGYELGSKILRMFQPEYVTVTYWDLLDCANRTAVFYVGDRAGEPYSYADKIAFYNTISFNLIERKGEAR